MQLLLLGGEDVKRALPMADAIETMKAAFQSYSSGASVCPPRLAVGVPDNDAVMLVKPASIPGEGLGAKLVSVFPGNAATEIPVVTGAVILLDPSTGEPTALLDGTVLTAWRTGAASGAATDVLARTDAARAAIIGCGAQGRTQAVAVDTARELDELRVFDRDPRQVERLVDELGPLVRARIVGCHRVENALDGADIICTATTSSTPVLTSDLVADGAHINGVGSFTPEMREIDDATIARARIVVDSREMAMTEAGELIDAVDQRTTRPEDWSELGEIIAGSAARDARDDGVTLFKSVGLAVQDIAAAAAAVTRARRAGIGTVVELR